MQRNRVYPREPHLQGEGRGIRTPSKRLGSAVGQKFPIPLRSSSWWVQTEGQIFSRREIEVGKPSRGRKFLFPFDHLKEDFG